MSDEHKRYLDKLSHEHLQGLGYDSTGSDSEDNPQNPAKTPAGAPKNQKSADLARAGSDNADTETSKDNSASAQATARNGNAGDAQDPYRVKPGLGTLIRHLLRRIFKGHR